ncbi:MAG TPA: helix-turn-helix domain-containing protein [Candidatus Dormibacteraeota bacterium]|nr:helix-turn-helix domain-containing protein [Candidatus Dormibacteraeota bacterium]
MPIVVPPQAPALAPLIRSLSIIGEMLPSRLERMVPTGDMNLLVNLDADEFRTYDGPDRGRVRRVRGAVLAGPRDRHTVIDTEEQRRLLIVHFRPGGALPFLAASPWETSNQFVALHDLWGADGCVLRERLLEAATTAQKLKIVESTLLEHAVRPLRPDPAIAFAVAAFERGVSVSEVMSRLGLLPKSFTRRFRERIGLLPKRFSRVRRLQGVLEAIERRQTVDWAEIALDHRYCDQAHLINDFRELVGMTPSTYLQAVGQQRNHVPLPSPD